VAMIDSGCNAILLPICNKEQLDEMAKLFPPNRFVWSVGGSKGVGAVHSPTLVLKPLGSEPKQTFSVSLGQDVFQNTFELPFLRFHVCYEDAKTLNSTAHVIGKQNLVPFISKVETLQKAIPNLEIAERRYHALIGQAILRQPGSTVLQLPSVMIVTTLASVPPVSGTVLANLDRSLAGKCLDIVSKHFEVKEFQELEDEDHDDDFYYNPSPTYFFYDD